MRLNIYPGMDMPSEIEGRKVTVLGMSSEYVAIQYPGSSKYIDSENGTQYLPAHIIIGKIEFSDFSLTPQLVDVDPVLEFNLRK
jgi:hypothetical protein